MLDALRRMLSRTPASKTLADERSALGREREEHLLASDTFAVPETLQNHPAKPGHAKKKVLFELALRNHPSGTVAVDRYGPIPPPDTYNPYSPELELSAVPGFFTYANEGGGTHWHMNFAHHDLFHSYGHFMFAQDEIQVAEHPVLASIREAMLQRGDRLRPLAVEDGAPTPVLFHQVPRTLRIDTRKIYGARFARSEDELIRASAQRVEPPAVSNILAIEAPISSGNRVYSRGEIQFALGTAYAGFRALVLTCATGDAAAFPVVLHTGNWGCGAYGGNRPLMISLQIMAASLAGLGGLVVHCGADSPESVTAFASDLRARFGFRPGARVSSVVDKLVQAAFAWGTPDGN